MFIHDSLYHFWFRSIGVWDSLLVKVTANWLSEQELISLCQIHHLSQPEFGVTVSWEYKKRSDSGNMSWCVDANHASLIFANKTLKPDSPPSVLNYKLPDANKLVITVGQLEETFVLASDKRRLRELRYQGKLLRRLWEEKVSGVPQSNLVTPSGCITKSGDLMKLPEINIRLS